MRSSRLSRFDRALLPSLPTTTSSGRYLPHRATTSGRTIPPCPRLLPITTDPSHLSDPVWMVATAVAAVLASWVFNALVYLVWRPHAITRQLRTQGVGGPGRRATASSPTTSVRSSGSATTPSAPRWTSVTTTSSPWSSRTSANGSPSTVREPQTDRNSF
ncbi:hypothetical protein ZWY2020_056666 [Hordeum vulgare]|nr:hypothetical protein ZWY2020_056666 [Hordeum vulgare]